MRYQKEVDKCHEQIKKCDKHIKRIKQQDKFSTILVGFCIVVALLSLIAQEFGYALFMAVLGLVNYAINKFTQGLIPSFETHKRNYNDLIRRWQDCDNLTDETEALKRRNDELERSLS